MSTSALAAAARAVRGEPAVGLWRSSGSDLHSKVVRVFGSPAGVVYQFDDEEVARRAELEAIPLTRLDVLDVLMGLPVTPEVLAGSERARLRYVPSHAIDLVDGQLVRRAVAPLSVHLAMVAARDWRTGIKRAGRFAPFCARMILLPSMPSDEQDLRMQASFYGCGVCVFVGDELEIVVEPQPYARRRHTPSQWLFAEQLHAQVTECELG